MTTTMNTAETDVKCDRCAEIGIDKVATHDAPSPFGPWHYVCGAHLYRLPTALQSQAVEVS